MHEEEVVCRSGAQEIREGATVIKNADTGEATWSLRREKGAEENHTEVRGRGKTYKADSGRTA